MQVQTHSKAREKKAVMLPPIQNRLMNQDRISPAQTGIPDNNSKQVPSIKVQSKITRHLTSKTAHLEEMQTRLINKRPGVAAPKGLDKAQQIRRMLLGLRRLQVVKKMMIRKLMMKKLVITKPRVKKLMFNNLLVNNRTVNNRTVDTPEIINLAVNKLIVRVKKQVVSLNRPLANNLRKISPRTIPLLEEKASGVGQATEASQNPRRSRRRKMMVRVMESRARVTRKWEQA